MILRGILGEFLRGIKKNGWENQRICMVGITVGLNDFIQKKLNKPLLIFQEEL